MTEKPRNYLSQQERRAQLLELGLELFSAQSYDEVSTDDIARRAGVSKGLMYHYFGNKRGFYTAVVRFLAASIREFVAPSEHRSKLENLRHGLDSYLSFVEKHGTAYLALINGGIGYDETINEIIEETRQAIVRQIIETIGARETAGWYRTATRSWLGAVEAAAQDWLAHKDTERVAVVSMLIVSLFSHLRVAAHLDPEHQSILDPEVEEFVMQILVERPSVS